MSEINPAMTPEEWRVGEYERQDGIMPTRIASLDGERGVDINGYVDYCYGVVVKGGERHALAALCLYGQPFGFDWEDIDRLRISRGIRTEVYDDIADRIAALLPPRDAA